MEDESVSVCGLHPGVAVTGFCPACLRDRLAGLHPPSADLRRCKSFSYYARSSYLEPSNNRRSSLLHDPDAHIKDSSTTTKPSFGSLAKRWQEWRRKSKLKKQPTMPDSPSPALARRSCDVFSTRAMLGLGVDEPRASCDAYHAAHPMLFVPRSDDQIPVEEEEERAHVPGGSAQTRDYYLDSSSSSRRRRSVDRKSFSSDAGDQIPRMVTAAAAANARVSPATELYHHHHHHQQQIAQPHTLQYHQPSFDPPPFLRREREEETATTKSKPKNKGIKGWSIWGLLHKKSSSSSNNSVGATASAFGGEARAAAPELRARGYDGQMLRCNSSVSARSSFSGIGSSFNGGGLGGRMRRADEVLLERNFSARYSSSSSCRYQHQQFHKDDYSNSIANNSGAGAGRPPRSSATSTLPRTSLGLYYY
uniref:DUF740 family protein n=1 Tax=Oryza punctata TaxID=4537 RepID=A0A0E0MIG0_ORYPU